MRMDQMSKWALTAHQPTIFWMSGFTFPTGFLTAVLQTYARKNNVSLNRSWTDLCSCKDKYSPNSLSHPHLSNTNIGQEWWCKEGMYSITRGSFKGSPFHRKFLQGRIGEIKCILIDNWQFMHVQTMQIWNYTHTHEHMNTNIQTYMHTQRRCPSDP